MGRSKSGPGAGASLNDVLIHFGVKGMKWGVRGTKPSIGSSEDAQRAEASKAKVKAGGTKALSNKELQELVTRMNLERQFSKLKSATPSKKAAKFVADMLLNVGKQQLTTVAVSLIAKQVANMMKK